jgi:hypothetical protein
MKYRLHIFLENRKYTEIVLPKIILLCKASLISVSIDGVMVFVCFQGYDVHFVLEEHS